MTIDNFCILALAIVAIIEVWRLNMLGGIVRELVESNGQLWLRVSRLAEDLVYNSEDQPDAPASPETLRGKWVLQAPDELKGCHEDPPTGDQPHDQGEGG